MKQYLLIFVFLLKFSPVVFAQGRSELLRLGDAAFKNGNYASAVFFYNKVVTGSSSGILSIVHPYDLKNYVKPPEKPGTSSRSAIDSLAPDTVIHASNETIFTTKSDSVESNISGDELKMLPVIYRLAEAYRLSYNYDNAETWYGKVTESKSAEFPQASYWYGNALLKNSKYEKAMQVLSEYLKSNTDAASEFHHLGTLDFKKCLFAVKSGLRPNKGVTIEKANPLINRGGSNFALTFWEEESAVVFTSASLSKKMQADEEKEMGPLCDLYSVSSEDGNEIKRVELPSTLNHQGTAVFSPDKTKMYFTQWMNDKDKSECAIYVSKFLFNKWLQPKKLDEQVNVPGYKSMQPALSEDGTVLYFASDRPKGAGKMDLWSCVIDEFDNIQDVKNMGARINTSENEVTPFFHSDSRFLYYSSDGRIGMGGLDIYKIQTDNIFAAESENIGYPYNTSRDDAYFILNKEKKEGYLSSDRESCTDCQGGNCYSIYKFINKDNVTIIVSGKVYDSETNKVLANTLIYLNDVDNKVEPIFVLTDENGFYSVPVPKDMDLYATAQKVKYFKDAAHISTKGIKSPAKINHDFHLKPIPSGEIDIPGIEYDYDKATLRPVSKTILDRIVDFLTLNDNIIVEISSHTDVRGNDDYNQVLSQARAKSVVDYLIEKGIAEDRLKPTGYGETKLLVANATTEAQHQRNRRTAFRILSEGYLAGGGKVKYTSAGVPAAPADSKVANEKESIPDTPPSPENNTNIPGNQKTSAMVSLQIDASSSALPEEFKNADKNNDGKISVNEISGSIDDFFEGDSKLSIDQVYQLIDYFFEQ